MSRPKRPRGKRLRERPRLTPPRGGPPSRSLRPRMPVSRQRRRHARRRKGSQSRPRNSADRPTVTGYFGPRTRTMITAWQKAQGLPETGYLTEAQLAALQHQARIGLDEAQRKLTWD